MENPKDAPLAPPNPKVPMYKPANNQKPWAPDAYYGIPPVEEPEPPPPTNTRPILWEILLGALGVGR